MTTIETTIVKIDIETQPTLAAVTQTTGRITAQRRTLVPTPRLIPPPENIDVHVLSHEIPIKDMLHTALEWHAVQHHLWTIPLHLLRFLEHEQKQQERTSQDTETIIVIDLCAYLKDHQACEQIYNLANLPNIRTIILDDGCNTHFAQQLQDISPRGRTLHIPFTIAQFFHSLH